MVTQTQVIEHIVEQDHRLEAQASGSARALMEHRWHWTLDDSNPDRMSIRAYAERVGKHWGVIARYAKGFVLLSNVASTCDTPYEALLRAGMSVDTEDATAAVAKARGLSFTSVHQGHQPEVRRVRETARQLAEKNDTWVADEAPQVAEMFVRAERSEERREEQRQGRMGLRFIEVENELDKARRHLLKAAKVSEGVLFEQEQRDLLAHTLDNVRRLLEMMDRAIVGQYTPDWGEALRMIEGGVAS